MSVKSLGALLQAAFDVVGNNLVPWTEAANQTFASAIKFAIVRQLIAAA